MKVIILGGFSGAGKTTLLLRLTEYLENFKGKQDHAVVAVIENEIGTADIDAKRLADRGIPVESLLADRGPSKELADWARRMRQRVNPDWLVVEAAGLGIPWKIKESLREQSGLDILIWVVVDAGRWLILNDSLSRLAVEQLNGADVVLVNKCDLVSQDLRRRVEISVNSKTERAVMISVSAAKAIKSSVWKQLLNKDVRNG